MIANIPVQIGADGDTRHPQLAGFPLNLLYTGHRASREDGEGPRVAAACYWFDPDTYREDEQTREMRYFPRAASPYSVRVTLQKRTGMWETFKFRGEKLVCAASGATFDQAMLHTTLIGLDADEPESTDLAGGGSMP